MRALVAAGEPGNISELTKQEKDRIE